MGQLFNFLTPTQRMTLFICACIPFRFALIVIVFFLFPYTWFQSIFLIFTIFAIFNNLTKLNQNVWWHRPSHLITSSLLFVSTILVLLGYQITPYIMIILGFDIIIGIVTFLCKNATVK